MSRSQLFRTLCFKSLVLIPSLSFADNLFLEGTVPPRIGVDVKDEALEVQSTPGFEFHVHVERKHDPARGPASSDGDSAASSFTVASQDLRAALHSLPVGSYKVEFRAP